MKKIEFKKVLNYFLPVVSLITLILLLFPVIKIVSGETIIKLTGTNIATGVNFKTVIEKISNIKPNIQVVVCMVALVIGGCLSAISVEKHELLKNIGLILVYVFTSISIIQIPNSVKMINGYMTSNVSFTVIGYVALALSLIALVYSICKVSSLKIKSLSDEHSKIIRYVVSGCLAIILFGLLFNIVVASNNTESIKVNGIRLILGGYFKNQAFGLTKCEVFYPIIITFGFVIISLVLNLLSINIKHKIFDQISFVLMAFVVFSIATLPSNCLEFIGTNVNKSLTGFGNIILIISLVSLILFALVFLSNYSLKEFLNIFAASFILIAILSCYRLTYSCYIDSTGSKYDFHYFSAFELMFKNVRYEEKKTIGELLFIPYSLMGLSVLSSFVKIKTKKMSYFVSFMLAFASVILMLTLGSSVFLAITEESSFVCKLYQNGVITAVLVALSSLIYLYLSSIEKPIKGE